MAPIPKPLLSLPAAAHDIIASLARRSPSIARSAAQTLPRTLQLVNRKTHDILKRQSLTGSNDAIIPTTYGEIDKGPSPSTVVGIVLGSVGGFLLVLWLIYTCATLGGVANGSDYTESIVVARRKSHGSRSTRSRRMSETVEVRRDAPPVRIVPVAASRTEHVIVEESRQTRRERSRGGSDEVVVIEEHSPPRRSKSKRKEGRDSGYRVVDANAYGGVVGGRRSSGGSRR